MMEKAVFLEEIFRTIFDLSVMGSVVILLVLLTRKCLKNVPRIFSYILWVIPAIRLLVPITFQGIWGVTLQNGTKVADAVRSARATNVVNRSYEAIQQGVGLNEMASQGQVADVAGAGGSQALSVSHSLFYYAAMVWVVGVMVLLFVSLLQYIRLKKKLAVSICQEKGVYINDSIPTAFVFGVIRTKIYVPSALEETYREMIILHETTHLMRRDHLVKLCGFFILCLHWFNPIVWIGYHFFVQDMEMSCDEAVLRKKAGIRAEYATALLQTAVGGMGKMFLPAFGEGNTKSRIKNVMRDKKKKKITLFCAGALVVCVAAVLLFNLPNQLGGAGDTVSSAKPVTTAELSVDGYYELQDEKDTYEYTGVEFVPNLMLQDGKKFYLQFASKSYHFEGEYNVAGNMLVLTDEKTKEQFYFVIKGDLNLKYDKKRSSGILASSSMSGAIHEVVKGNLSVFKKMEDTEDTGYPKRYTQSSSGESEASGDGGEAVATNDEFENAKVEFISDYGKKKQKVWLDQTQIQSIQKTSVMDEVTKEWTDQYQVICTEDGAEKLKEMTQKNLYQEIAFVVDGEVISKPTIQVVIEDGRFMLGATPPEEDGEASAQN